MPTETIETLTEAQRVVLEKIYELFYQRGEWPTFADIDRPLRRERGIDAGEVIHTLPRSLVNPVGPGAGVPNPEAPLSLTLLGITRCPFGDIDADRLARLLPCLAALEAAHLRTADEPFPAVTAAEVARVVDIDPLNGVGLGRIFHILNRGRWGLGSSHWQSGTEWAITLDRDIWRFHDVKTVQNVLDIERGPAVEIPKPNRQSLIDFVRNGFSEYEVEATAADLGEAETATPYVDEKTIGLLRAKEANGAFELSKLLALIAELNDNYAAKNTYATLALIRTVINHVPPIFACETFGELANNHPWPPTKGKYVKNLASYRPLADDALHTKISPNHDVLSPGDIPPPAWVRTLLLECAARL